MTAIHGVTTEVHAAQRSMNMRVDAMGHHITNIRTDVCVMHVTNSSQPVTAPAFQGGFQNDLPAQSNLPSQSQTFARQRSRTASTSFRN